MELSSTISMQHQRMLEATLRNIEDALLHQVSMPIELAMQRVELLIHLDREADAIIALKEVLEQNPSNGKAHWLLSCLDDDLGDVRVNALEQMLEDIDVDISDKDVSREGLKLAHNFYALGLLQDRRRNFDQAFTWFRKGADFMTNCLEKREPILDDWLRPELKDILCKTLDKNWLNQKQEGLLGQGPIFLVGMPGAGLSYIEALLSTHPDIHAGGALPYFAEQVNKLVLESSKAPLTCEIVRKASVSDMWDLGVNYMISSRNARGERPYFVDRQARNFLYLPFIAMALPDAKMIHVRRCPIDTCLSDFKWLYSEGHRYSYGFDSLSNYYALYNDIMTHYLELLGDRVLTVDYETVIQSPGKEIAKLYDYIGLAAPDGENAVQPLNITDKFLGLADEPFCHGETELWRRYQNHIAPLIKALKASGIPVQID